MTATVLAYGYEGRELKTLKTVCARLDIRLRRVTEEEYAQPVGTFFALTPRREGGESAAPVPERMVVLGGLTSRQLDAFLSAMKTARAGECLKAVLTEHNARWTGAALYAELVRERAKIENKKDTEQ